MQKKEQYFPKSNKELKKLLQNNKIDLSIIDISKVSYLSKNNFKGRK